MAAELNQEQRELIHDNIRAMLAGHKAARWILEDVSAHVINAMDGDFWDAGKMHSCLEEYRRAIECVGFSGINAVKNMIDARR